MKAKKKTLTSILALIAGIVKAFIWLVVAILVLVVAGIILYELWPTIKRLGNSDGSTSQTNDTKVVYVHGPPGGLPPGARPDEETTLTTPFLFTIQYGINLQNQMWVAVGSNMVQSVDGDINEIRNDEQWYEYTITKEGWTAHLVARADTLDTDQDYSVMVPPQSLVIEVSTNLVDWYPLFTNAVCGVNTVETFTDSNAPPERAFYRSVRY